MLRSSFCAGLRWFVSSLVLLCTLTASLWRLVSCDRMLLLAFDFRCFSRRSIVVVFQRSIAGFFVGVQSSVLSSEFNRRACIGVQSSCFSCCSIAGAFVVVQSLVLLSEFYCRCFRRRSIVGAFVDVQSSVLLSAFNHQSFVGVQSLVLLSALNRWCFCWRSIFSAFVVIQSPVLRLDVIRKW